MLGIYVGNPNGNNAAENAAFKSNFDKFIALFGQRPVSMNAFIDFTQSPAQWGDNASWAAWSWAQTGDAYVGPKSGVVPCIGLPMSCSGLADPGPFFQDIVAGKYDAVLSSIVTGWSGAGYTHLRFRPGYEANGSFMQWRAVTPSNATLFVSAFRRIAVTLRSVCKSLNVQCDIIWSMACISWQAISMAALYPGDDYVDIIGPDIYSPTYPGQNPLTQWDANGNRVSWDGVDANTWAANANNRRHFWKVQDANQWSPNGTGQGLSWQAIVAFAKVHNKPLAICECGAGGNDANLGPRDEDAFAPWLAGAIADAGGVLFVNIWATNQSDGAWGFLNGEQPKAEAAWKTAFGKVAPTLTLTLSEDAASDGKTADAQCVVTLDGVATTHTITASHAAGATQTVTLPVSTGSHSVTVAFTNDYCAWVNGGWAGNVPGKDRNLYLLSASVNGVAIPNAAHTFKSNGSLTLAFSV